MSGVRIYRIQFLVEELIFILRYNLIILIFYTIFYIIYIIPSFYILLHTGLTLRGVPRGEGHGSSIFFGPRNKTNYIVRIKIIIFKIILNCRIFSTTVWKKHSSISLCICCRSYSIWSHYFSLLYETTVTPLST